MHTSAIKQRPCPVCQSTDANHVFFKRHIVEEKLDGYAYASRKIPEFMNYELVACPDCDLLYTPTLQTTGFLQNAYAAAEYDSNSEAHFAANSYGYWLKQLVAKLTNLHSALDIGTGNGAFLPHLLASGFKQVIGVEPSLQAYQAADEEIRGHIQLGMFNVEDYSENDFNLISIFQTLEHIDAPQKFFKDAYRLLQPGGALLMAAHNYRHWLSRLLGRKSPIIDIEHLQLFSPASLRYALQQAGYRNIFIGGLQNVYPLHYWVKLLPIPLGIKKWLLPILKRSRLGNINLKCKVGNMIAWAFK
jgi:SAM-dependent methyltransferase